MAIRGKIGSLSRTAILALAVVFAAKGVCQAWWPSAWGNSGWLGGYSPWLSDLERLPYFALHPPVYYSHPVPRTYGYTPFASLPDLTIFEARQADPVTIRNPYVASSGAAAEAIAASGAPLVVRNPFVDRPAKASGGKKKLAAK
jgi:hypothetical protein